MTTGAVLPGRKVEVLKDGRVLKRSCAVDRVLTAINDESALGASVEVEFVQCKRLSCSGQVVGVRGDSGESIEGTKLAQSSDICRPWICSLRL